MLYFAGKKELFGVIFWWWRLRAVRLFCLCASVVVVVVVVVVIVLCMVATPDVCSALLVVSALQDARPFPARARIDIVRVSAVARLFCGGGRKRMIGREVQPVAFRPPRYFPSMAKVVVSVALFL